MHIISMPRQGGKTTRVIHWLAGNAQRVLVVHNFKEKQRLSSSYPEVAQQIIVYNEHKVALPGRKVTEVAVDNLDLIIQQMLNYPVTVATVTEDFEDV